MAPEGTTSLEALGIAIRAEIDASEIYAELAGRAGNHLIQERLLLLAKEEQQHRRILEERYRQQFPDVPLALPASQLSREICSSDLRGRLSVKTLLRCAIDQERQARQFYLEQAEATQDLSGKRMFNYLADLEFNHQMQLSVEYDLFTRFPRSFEHNTDPWKPEFRS